MNLMKKSEALIVNTSTMGLEAGIMGLGDLFGFTFFSFIPSIYSLKSFKDIEGILSTPWTVEQKANV